MKLRIIEEELVLSESPQFIDDTNFGFDIEQTNIHLTKEIINNYTVLGKSKFRRFTIYLFSNKIMLVDDANPDSPKTVYYVQFEKHHSDILNRDYIEQVVLWSDTSDVDVRGVSETLFFDNLLPKFRTVVTDKLQTKAGNRYWDLRISDAFRRGADVYYFDATGPTSIVKIKDDNDYQLLKRSKDIWGYTKDHADRLLAITLDPI